MSKKKFSTSLDFKTEQYSVRNKSLQRKKLFLEWTEFLEWRKPSQFTNLEDIQSYVWALIQLIERDPNFSRNLHMSAKDIENQRVVDRIENTALEALNKVSNQLYFQKEEFWNNYNDYRESIHNSLPPQEFTPSKNLQQAVKAMWNTILSTK